jgi:YD repeat-containing protein
LLTTTDPEGKVRHSSYSPNYLTSTTKNLSGKESTVTKDTKGRTVKTVDYAGNVTTFTYDETMATPQSENLPVQINYPDFIQKISYDLRGRTLSTTIIENGTGFTSTTSNSYNTLGQLVSTTNAEGHRTYYNYDELGRTKSVTNAAGGITSTKWDNRGNVISVTDAKGNVTRSEYDLNNRVVKRINALGIISTFEYDADGNNTVTTDGEGNKVVNIYDGISRVVSTSHFGAADPSTPLSTVTYEYNTLNQLAAVVDSGNRRTEFEYDLMGGKVLTRQFLDGAPITTTTAYDSKGNQSQVVNVKGLAADFLYNDLNQLVIAMAPSPDGSNNRPVTTQNYDSKGRMVKLTKPNGEVWQYVYSGLGRLLQEIDPLGFAKSYEYSPAGNITKKTDAKGQETTFSYDALSRLIKVTYSDGTWTEMTYDANSNRTSITGSEGIALSSTFDELNRITEITNGSLQRKLTYAYTANSQRSSRTVENLADATTKTTAYSWNGLGQIEEIQPPAGTSSALTFTYNPDGSRNVTNLPNGLTVNHSYDSLGRLTGMAYNGTNGPVAAFNYTLDVSGNRVTMTDNEGVTNYTYDNLNRLTRAEYPDSTWEAFSMNIGGNRVRHQTNLGTTDYNYGAGSRLLSTTGKDVATYSWDNNGNMTAKTTPEGVTTYTWNSRDKQTQVVLPDGGTNQYSYYPGSDLRYSVSFRQKCVN